MSLTSLSSPHILSPEEVLLHCCPSIHPFKQKTCTLTHRLDALPTYSHTPTLQTHANTLTTGHTSGGLRAQPSAHPVNLSPPLQYPPSQHMQPLPWVRWQGHWPWSWPREGWRSTYVVQTVSLREKGAGWEDTETNQGLDRSLFESLLLALSHPHGWSLVR